MTVAKRAAPGSAAHARRGAAGPGESGGVASIAQTFKMDSHQRISLMELMTRIGAAGIESDDPRVREIVAELSDRDADGGGGLTMNQFTNVCEASGGLIARALRGDLVVPDFSRFTSELQAMYARVREDTGGAVADHIPQLRRVDPEKFGVAVCTVDGQRYSTGDTSDLFCVQSMCKPINYSLALEEHGVGAVHRHVGREVTAFSTRLAAATSWDVTVAVAISLVLLSHILASVNAMDFPARTTEPLAVNVPGRAAAMKFVLNSTDGAA